MAFQAIAAALPGLASVGSRIAGALPGVGSVVSGVKNSLPHLEDEAVVRVTGNPRAKKKDLYYLALAAAFGLVKRFDAMQWAAPPPGLLAVRYDAASSWVEVTLKYRTSLFTSAVAYKLTPNISNFLGAIGSIFGNPVAGGTSWSSFGQQIFEYLSGLGRLPLYSDAVIYAGPKDELVGANFGFTGFLSPGLPNTPQSAGAPKLPFAGKVILTKSPTCPDPSPAVPVGSNRMIPTPNPLPSGDARSRGDLVSMVFASLSDPGSSYLMTYELRDDELRTGG